MSQKNVYLLIGVLVGVVLANRIRALPVLSAIPSV